MSHCYPTLFIGGRAGANLLKLFWVIVNYGGLVFLTCTATAAQGEGVTPKPHPEIRRAIAESFPYRSGDRDQSSSEVRPPQQGEADSEIVVLPKFEVRSRALDRDLPDAIAHYQSTAPQNHSKLGTGIHERDLGKVRLSCVTVLYIPIQFGISW